MKTIRKIFKNESGMSLPLVVALVSVAVGSVGYLAVNLIPKLQDERKKAEVSIHYRTFMSSINDYLLHGIRERWCLNVNANGETDLLLSNNCGKGVPMEDIVTYKGNLERVLWTADNISPENERNKILGLNKLRIIQNKTARKLTYDEIYPTDGKLTFAVPRSFFEDMTEKHPLYIISKEVKGCIDTLNIEIFQVKDLNNAANGEERKIGIKIVPDIRMDRITCLMFKEASSVSYYTFYPRKLNTFSLLKYGDLDTKDFNEFHGPVYVAGNIILPPEEHDKTKGSVFFNTLTLGVYNAGEGTGGTFYAGTILNADKSKYTFEDRGHPYLSRHDNYPGFRGFLGGVRLDATEDKGFYNLFDHKSINQDSIATLEACIEDTKAITTPSVNAGSKLAYKQLYTDAQRTDVQISFTKKNRFKADVAAPSVVGSVDQEGDFIISVPEPANGVTADGLAVFNANPEDYMATLGGGSQIDFGINLKKFDLSVEKVDGFLNNLANVDHDNFTRVVDAGHVILRTDESKEFQDAADDLDDACRRNDRFSVHCGPLGYKVTCDYTKDSKCNHSSEFKKFNDAKDKFNTALGMLKNVLASGNGPVMTVSMGKLSQNGKLIINQRKLSYSFSSEWKFFTEFLKEEIPDQIDISFSPYHYGVESLPIKVRVAGNDFNEVELINQQNGQTVGLATGWKYAFNNTPKSGYINPDPPPLFELDCPSGMGLADWDLDMSASTNFAWNYANTPPGAQVDTSDHSQLDKVIFNQGEPWEGFNETTKSVVDECIVQKERTHVYGFYVCRDLYIKGGRTAPLNMIGTFIVKNIYQEEKTWPVYWHSVWDTKSSDLVMNHLKASNPACGNQLVTKTWIDLKREPALLGKIEACSSLDLVSNGPNNFSWTTVDPDIGIANPDDAMTSQKTKRTQKWIIREDSRRDSIR